jgi:ABC-type transporter Mla subunit MlaD
MSNTCTLLREIENVSQKIANFLSKPSSFTSSIATRLSNQIQKMVGAVRELPISSKQRKDIINRLRQAERILSNTKLEKVDRLLAALEILQVVALKVRNRCVPCTQGLTSVHPSNTFSTVCNFCGCH